MMMNTVFQFDFFQFGCTVLIGAEILARCNRRYFDKAVIQRTG
jgi:hypothetical protein